jgi:hypothetical protein
MCLNVSIIAICNPKKGLFIPLSLPVEPGVLDDIATCFHPPPQLTATVSEGSVVVITTDESWDLSQLLTLPKDL